MDCAPPNTKTQKTNTWETLLSRQPFGARDDYKLSNMNEPFIKVESSRADMIHSNNAHTVKPYLC